MPSIKTSRENGKGGKFCREHGKQTGILGKNNGSKGGRPRKIFQKSSRTKLKINPT